MNADDTVTIYDKDRSDKNSSDKDNPDNNSISLIICTTPLQVLIAEHIINLFPTTSFFGVMVTYATFNKKYAYYFQRLQQCCSASQFIIVREHKYKFLRGKLRKIYHFWHLKKLCCLPVKKFDQVFVANINETLLQGMLSQLDFRHFMTFDDGTANILPGSFLYQRNHCRKNTFPFKNRYSLSQLRELSEKHYTIYPGHKNITEPVEVISLSACRNAGKADTKAEVKIATNKPVRILLSQPLLEPDWQASKTLLEQVIDQWQITHYFPHPRDPYQLANAQPIQSDFIFEDYLSQEIQRKPDVAWHIYTLGSSAALNVIHFPNVTIKLICIESIADIDQRLPWYQDLINLFATFHVDKLYLRQP